MLKIAGNLRRLANYICCSLIIKDTDETIRNGYIEHSRNVLIENWIWKCSDKYIDGKKMISLVFVDEV